MNEIWRDIKGYEGLYQISSYGRVKSLHQLKRGKKKGEVVILRLHDNGSGYLHTGLYKNRVGKSWNIHRLVAEAFIPNPKGLEQINHKDENKSNNHISNLEWCTRSYNVHYSGNIENLTRRNQKPVHQIKNGSIIATYPSAKIACDMTGISRASISGCRAGKLKTAGGYEWSYVRQPYCDKTFGRGE